MTTFIGGALSQGADSHPLPTDKEELRRCYRAFLRISNALRTKVNVVKIANAEREQGITGAWVGLGSALFGLSTAQSAVQFVVEQIAGTAASEVIESAIKDLDGFGVVDKLGDALGVTEEVAEKSGLPGNKTAIDKLCQKNKSCQRYYALVAETMRQTSRYGRALRTSDTVFGTQTAQIVTNDDV